MISAKTISISRYLFVIYLLVVCYLCFFRINAPEAFPKEFLGIQMDKIAHFLLFIPFPFLFYFSAGKVVCSPVKSVFHILAIFVLGCIIAASTELVQGFMPYRTPDRMDFLADALALALGSIIICLINIKLCKKS